MEDRSFAAKPYDFCPRDIHGNDLIIREVVLQLIYIE